MTPRGKITLVLFFFAVCATAVIVHTYDVRHSGARRPTEFFDVVHQQLAACRCDDFPAAYRHASATVQRQCPLERFSSTTRNDYARVLKNSRVEFGPWQCQGDKAVVEVFFIARDGNVTPCVYTLVCEGETWKIDNTRWVQGWKTGQRMRGIRS